MVLKLKVPAFSDWIDNKGGGSRSRYYYRHPLGNHPVIKQNFIICGAILLAGMIFSGIFYWAGTSHVMHNEVWNYKIVEVQHWERWTTRESRQVRYACGTDSDGNTEYCYRTEYYTETHGPYWYAIDQYGDRHRIDESEYNQWRRTWDNEETIGHNRGSSAGFDRSISGDIFSCDWTREFNEMFTWHHVETYENRIRSSTSVFREIEPTEEMIAQWPRPADNRDTSPVHAFGVNITGEDQITMQRYNALLGPIHQVHILVYLFDSSEYSTGVTDEILSAWNGLNKNELVVFAGLDGRTVDWIRVESWADNTTFHGMLEQRYYGQQLRLGELGEYIKDNIGGNWERKQFEDFNYIKIKISPLWYFLEGLICLVVGVVVIMICKFQLS